MKETTMNFRVITLKDLWDIFMRRITAIVLAAVIVAGGYFAIDRLAFQPMYNSTATLYLLRENENMSVSSGEAANEFNLALKMVNDCNYLIKSRSVVERVIWDLDLDVDYARLRSRISVANPTNTRILEVSVEAESPQQAKDIVDRLCEIGQASITDAMGFQQVNLYEYGTLESRPCNRTGLMTFLLAGTTAALLVYGVYLLAFLLDDRLRTEEDIENVLGLSILAEIPNLGGIQKRRYGYYRGYGYGYGRRAYGYGQKKDSTDKEKRS